MGPSGRGSTGHVEGGLTSASPRLLIVSSLMDSKARREHARGHISPKLRRSLRMFLVVSAVLLLAVIFEAVRYHASFWQVGLGLVAGVLIGTVFSRMYKLSWDEDAQHVVSRIDIYGVVVLVAYVAFDLLRENLVHVFTHNEGVPAISLALLAGGMYGRTVGSVHVILGMLHDQKVFSRAPAVE